MNGKDFTVSNARRAARQPLSAEATKRLHSLLHEKPRQPTEKALGAVARYRTLLRKNAPSRHTS